MKQLLQDQGQEIPMLPELLTDTKSQQRLVEYRKIREQMLQDPHALVIEDGTEVVHEK